MNFQLGLLQNNIADVRRKFARRLREGVTETQARYGDLVFESE